MSKVKQKKKERLGGKQGMTKRQVLRKKWEPLKQQIIDAVVDTVLRFQEETGYGVHSDVQGFTKDYGGNKAGNRFLVGHVECSIVFPLRRDRGMKWQENRRGKGTVIAMYREKVKGKGKRGKNKGRSKAR